MYTRGYISYPRTETTQYAENFDFRSCVQQQTSNNSWGSYAKRLLETGFAKPRKGTDVGDHPPITPMRGSTEHEIGNKCTHFAGNRAFFRSVPHVKEI